MAGGKLTPRQKMINLMYLIFIAMLALNMSKEVLSGFGLFNEKFEAANIFAKQTNEEMLAALDLKATEAKGDFIKAALIAHKVEGITKKFYIFIDGLKAEVIKGIEVNEKGKLPYEEMDKADNLDQSWFAGDGYTPRGKEVIAAIEAYKAEMKAALDLETKYHPILKDLKSKFDLADVINKDGLKDKYLNYHFKGFPGIASLAKLSAWQNDVKKAESDIIAAALGKAAVSEASYSKFKAIVVLDKNVYFQGEAVTGKVVLGKYDPNAKFTGFKGPGRLENGQAVISATAGSVGEQTLSGSFNFSENNEPIVLPFTGKYVVVPKPNKSTVSSDNMQIIYQEVDNPMSISFGGVQNNNVTASAPGLKKVGNEGKYIWNVGKFKEKTVSVTVNAKLPDGKTVSDKQTFKVRPVPKPALTLNGDSGLKVGKASELADATLGINFGSFGEGYKISGKVTSVTLTMQGKSPILIPGAPGGVSISDNASAVAALKTLPKGSIVYITATYLQNNGSRKEDAYACSFKIN